MRTRIGTILAVIFPTLVYAQVLNGDRRLPLLNQIRWDMNKENVVSLCAANKTNVRGNDSTVTFTANLFDAPATVTVRFKNKTERPRSIEVGFRERPGGLPDTLIDHFTRTLGVAPVKAEKEKSVLLFTLRMEVAVWKTTKEKVNLIVAWQNKSIFDIKLTIEPAV